MATALKSGKPQLIIPFNVDQPFWANRLYTKGYALKPLKEDEVEVDILIERLKEMEKVQVKESAESIKTLIKDENG
jgi:sterol 3beta-glucosyltransferase